MVMAITAADDCTMQVMQNRVSQASALLPAEVTRAGVQVMKRQSSNVLIFALTGDPDKYDNQFVGNYADINIIIAKPIFHFKFYNPSRAMW